jgi:hypothetical protein
MGPIDCEPLVAFVAHQPPEALQDVALVEDQVSNEVPPALTVLGLAAMDTVGAAATTETVAD